MLLTIQVFLDVTLCRLVHSYWRFVEAWFSPSSVKSSQRNPEDVGVTLVRNVGNYLPVDTAEHLQNLNLQETGYSRNKNLRAFRNICIYIYIYIYIYTKTDNHAGNISALYCILITFAVNVQNWRIQTAIKSLSSFQMFTFAYRFLSSTRIAEALQSLVKWALRVQ